MNPALPSPTQRALLRGFWFVVSFTMGLAMAVLAGVLGRPWMMSLGALLAVLLGTLVFAKESLVWSLYRAWNRGLVRPLTALSWRVVLRLCYFIVFTATGRAGSRLPLAGLGHGSFWTPRTSLAAEAYGAPFAGAWKQNGRGGWVKGYVSWAFRSGNVWAVALLPYIGLLRLFSVQEESRAEGNIYTLF